jgi:O-antigen/teichoic acid export membrane protein
MTPSAQESTSSTLPGLKRLAGNTGWNLVGMCAPMVVALFSIPLLIQGLGEARFGVLALVWMLVGFFCIFDLGLGQALTKMVAERLGLERHSEVPGLFWTALSMMALLGCTGGALLWAGAPWLVHSGLNVPPHLRPETLDAFRVVALGMPVVITITGLIGVLEAYQRFKLINLVRIPTGMFTFLGPLAVLPFTQSLHAVVGVLIAGRVAECLFYFACCIRVVPALARTFSFEPSRIIPLLGFGGWMTVSMIATPLLIHIDRFLIGALLSVSAVAFYVTPAEIVVKLLIFPRAWVSVLFPAFAANFVLDRSAVAQLFGRGVKFLLAGSFPVILAVVAFAPEGLLLWLGPEFSERSTPVMRWLTAGILIYSLSFLPTALIQGAGRPDITAKVHIGELVLYLGLASLMIHFFGIAGAAMAWFIRGCLDALIMFSLSRRFVPQAWAQMRRVFISLFTALILTGLAVVLPGLWLRAGLWATGSIGFCVLAWVYLLTADERDQILQALQSALNMLRSKQSGG